MQDSRAPHSAAQLARELFGWRAEIGQADADHGFVFVLFFRRLFCPRAEDAIAIRSDADIVADEVAFACESRGRPSVIREGLSAIGRARECDGGVLVLSIVAAVVEDDVRCAACGIDREPLRELIGAIMWRIRIDSNSIAPRLASVR